MFELLDRPLRGSNMKAVIGSQFFTHPSAGGTEASGMMPPSRSLVLSAGI